MEENADEQTGKVEISSDLLQTLKGESLSSEFSTDGPFISASAITRCRVLNKRTQFRYWSYDCKHPLYNRTQKSDRHRHSDRIYANGNAAYHKTDKRKDYMSMAKIIFSVPGICKILTSQTTTKAAGPDGISSRVLTYIGPH